MAETTRNLGLPLIAAGQAQKHVTHNEALDRIDALAQLSVRDRDLDAPPVGAPDGERYIVGPAPTGAWSGLAAQLVLRRDGVWEAFAPRRGWIAYVEDEGVFVGWNGAAWVPVGEPGAALLAKLLAVDGDGSGLDADLLGGLRNESLAALGVARGMLVGGGLLSVSGTAEIRWSARILAVGFGRGEHWSGAGSFEIAVPPAGTLVAGSGGAGDRAATGGGIALGLGEALYYAPLLGGSAASRPERFHAVGTGAPFEVPPAWLCLCARNPDSGDVVFWNGLKLAPGQSYDRALSTAARPKLTGLGIGTDSDAVNALAVASPAILFNHAGEGVQAKLNKATTARTASLLFQTGFSGRAEFGLVGSDHVSLKVSPDGATFVTAFSVDPASGQVSFEAGSLREEVVVLTASGTWTKPAWARSVAITCLGGGGGGGAGRRGAAGSIRAGGGGGGAGAFVAESYPAETLPATLSLAVGAPGQGGAAVSSDNTGGNAGGAGGTTSVSAGGAIILAAPGGTGGSGGSTAGGAGGLGAGGGSLQTISVVTSSAVGSGGAGSNGTGAGATGTPGMHGAGGGGGGGGISAAEVAQAGGLGNYGCAVGGTGRRSERGLAGAVGAAGTAGGAKAWTRGAGAGGGGGGAADGTSPGGAGAPGGGPSGGGGGGGAATNGTLSGAGGEGARGEVWIVCRG